MSREVVGTAVPDLALRRAAARQAAPPPRPPASTGPERPGPAAVRPRWSTRRRAAVLVVALLAGTLAGWDGAGAWRRAQATEVALASATATAVVLGAEKVGGTAPPAPGSAVPGRTATLVVRLTNLGDVPLDVFGAGATFTAVRVRFLDPSGAQVPPRGRLTLRVAVEVTCDSPQILGVPPLRVVLPNDESRDVRIDAGAPVLAGLCDDRDAGPAAVPLVTGVAVPARTPVAALLDDGRFRLSMVAPSGRTTRVVGVRAGGLALTGDPLPMTVDGTARTMWLDQPARCSPGTFAAGLPRAVDVDVDAGSGQTATVHVPVGDALAVWLLAGPCGRQAAA